MRERKKRGVVCISLLFVSAYAVLIVRVNGKHGPLLDEWLKRSASRRVILFEGHIYCAVVCFWNLRFGRGFLLSGDRWLTGFKGLSLTGPQASLNDPSSGDGEHSDCSPYIGTRYESMDSYLVPI